MPLPFFRRLVLSKWVLSLFGADDLDDLSRHLKDDSLEEFDEDNISRFIQVISMRLPADSPFSRDLLLAYDENIVRWWNQIAQPRAFENKHIRPKYFQYLSLLFTEIYLDKYFQDKQALLKELNYFARKFNSSLDNPDQVGQFKLEELNKLAFWSATGSGKTLLMHINILQYRYYLKKYGHERELNLIILLTPNEGLSLQHLEEFKQSKMTADLFQKNGASQSRSGHIEIIDIHKLKDQAGEKTVSVGSFFSNNLVLVDEGHKGSGGKEWMDKRNRLCRDGFSFEYSATFGQSLKAAGNKSLTNQYARWILFDYSYRYFYRDGYGKDYRILNLADDSDSERVQLYLTACMLAFYQQLRLFEKGEKELRPFKIHKPLWVFVGSRVNAVRTENKQQVSDVTAILRFISRFTKDREKSIEALDRILKGRDGLTDEKGRSIFAAAFGHLHIDNLKAEEVYNDMLSRIFHARVPGKVHVEHLKGSDGEIALRIGEGNQPFGVINVGDAKKLWNLCNELDELVTVEKEFSESLFQKISDEDGGINLLIGSKKFTEGWNSWRVSTMGLMNIGKSEGSEIIQLFGRGVRLKGYNFCLKRSSELTNVKKPDYIRTCETLNVFGVRADYMQQFKDYLEEEGLPSEIEEIVLPVVKNLGKVKLKIPSVADGVDFKKDKRITLEHPPESFSRRPVTLDWYPRIQALVAKGIAGGLGDGQKNEIRGLTDQHLAFIDWDEVFFELVRYKNDRAWYNFNLAKDNLQSLVLKGGWYKLLIPQDDIDPVSFDNIRRCQEVVIALLKKYCERFYGYKKEEYEKPFMAYKELGKDDPNFFEQYRVAVDQSAQNIVAEVKTIKSAIEQGVLQDAEYGKLHSIVFLSHLYLPLLHIKGDSQLVKISPVALNQGEKDFVLDIRDYYQKNKSQFENQDLYLLRNLSKGKGIGFFEADNFHPDFILWLVQGSRQRIAFIDPKGILRLHGLNDPKIMFHQKIKDLEKRLGDKDVAMYSFIISNSWLADVKWWSGGDILEFSKRNVFFQKDEKDIYVQKIISGMC
ncbi:DEAD/DEAH box helicase family protein [Desulfonatronovibrio magnus]|uniref:DEAD/DEAH box helicase family protein n=1 Tax=Desulfonatronovibrio magnus TaxID=698827 RepID=UPI0005EBDFF9|nr:DEAD/DEAH box helicase family protein [Desulfonatronovibrio magnus]